MVVSWWGLNEASRSRGSAPERNVITAVEISQANKSRSTTVSIREYTFVNTSLAHTRRMDSSLFSMKGDGCAVHYPDVCISVFLLEKRTQGYASRNPAAPMGYQPTAIKHVLCRGTVKQAAYLWLLRLE